jgi:hypothetical protein
MRKKHTPNESLELPLGISPSLGESSKNNQGDPGVAELQGMHQQATSAANEFQNDPLIQKALAIFKSKLDRNPRPSRRSTGQTRERKDAGLDNKASGVQAEGARVGSSPAKEEVPSGYEAAHSEWLCQGGNAFKTRFQQAANDTFYRTHYWRLVREATLQRDRYTCYRCGEQATQVHHRHYWFKWEDHLHPETLVSVCYMCHGVIEYAREAETLAPRIGRRISACRSFADGSPWSEGGSPVKAFARLLEYREKFAEIRRLYESGVHYNSNREEAEAIHKEKAQVATGVPGRLQGIVYLPLDAPDAELDARDEEFNRVAKTKIGSWTGSDREKAARIIPLLEQELQNCLEFASRVVQPLVKCTCDSKPPRAFAHPGGLHPAYGDLRDEGLAEQSAAPNGGPAAPLGNPRVKEGPPSLS